MSVLVPPGASRRSGLLGALVIAAAGFLLHLPSLDHAPVLDDATLLSDAAAAESAGELFGRGLFGGVRGYGGYYRPLTALSFRAEAALGVGLRGAHVTNALLHALVAVAAFVLLRRLLGGLFVPFASALLFAVHPVHVDAVDPVTGRGDLLAAAFLLLAWVAFHVRRQGAPGGAIALAVSALLFAAGLLSKESAAVLPALAVAGEWVARRGHRKAMARRPGDYAVLLAVVAVYLALRTAILGGLIEPGLPDRLDNPLAGAGFAARMGTAPVAWLEMARLLLWPWPFSPDYSGGALELPSGPLDPRVLGGWVLALTLLGAWLWTGRRADALFLGLSILLAGVLPAANLLFTAPVLLAGRLLYLPSLGAALLLAAALEVRPGRSPLGAEPREVDRVRGRLGLRRATQGALLASIVAAWSLLALTLHPIYRDDLALWDHAIHVVPGNAKAWYNLGNARMRRGAVPEAESAYARATDLAPDLAIAWSNLGVARARLGRAEAARTAFLRAVELDPTLAQAHAGLGSLALGRGDRETALGHLETALALDPGGVDAATIRSLVQSLGGEGHGPGRSGRSDHPD